MTAFLVSFTCSLLEAAYLSITPSQLADIHQRNQQMGKMVAEQKEHIEKTIAVVLILFSDYCTPTPTFEVPPVHLRTTGDLRTRRN